jgi:hypothetical protein
VEIVMSTETQRLLEIGQQLRDLADDTLKRVTSLQQQLDDLLHSKAKKASPSIEFHSPDGTSRNIDLRGE